MIRKFLALIATLIGMLNGGCEMQFGTKYVNDPLEYGKWESYLDIPSYLPDSIEDYQVNSYSYKLLAYMDICYEIFLDLTVTEEQFLELTTNAREYSENSIEKPAYYCEGYYEIIYEDHYSENDEENEVTRSVEWADIEKVVYNEKTLNVIYVCFHANDSDVYDLDEVEYFNRFSINEDEYILSLEE